MDKASYTLEDIRNMKVSEEAGNYAAVKDAIRGLPKDPNMLLSYMNMMLRDRYSSLEDFCLTNDIEINEITDKLKAIGYQYDEKLNQFR